MLGRAAGIIAATYALGANGFLLPPGVNSLDDSLSFGPEVADGRTVRIPCSECVFSTKHEHVEGVDGEDAFRIQGGANDVLLDFRTSEDRKRLEVNGAPIYPPQKRPPKVVVHQAPASGDESAKVPLEVTSSGLMLDREDVGEDQESGLVTIRYHVLGLERQLMQLQPVKIVILKTGNELVVLSIDLEDADMPAPQPPSHHRGPPSFRPHRGPPSGFRPHGPPSDFINEHACNMLPAPICRFKQMLRAKIAHMRNRKPCPGGMRPPHGRLPSHIRPPLPHIAAHGEHPHPHPHPHHMRPWYGPHHHGHHRSNHWAGAFLRGFVAVLIPVVAGISVGLAVSLLGLVVGRVMSALWMRCARNGEHEEEREEEYAEEGKGLLLEDGDEEAEEPLPPYEDAPAYEESGGEKGRICY